MPRPKSVHRFTRDGDFLANGVVAAAKVADPQALARQLDQQASRGLAAGPAEPDILTDCVAPVCADRKNGHRPPTSPFPGVMIRPQVR